MATSADSPNPSSPRRLARWAKALRNRDVTSFHWRIIGDERLRASIDRRFDAELQRGNLPGDIIEVIEHELGRGAEYHLAELACERIERSDEYWARLQIIEEADFRDRLHQAWAPSFISLTNCAYWIATGGELRDPDDDILEKAARNLIGKLQGGEISAFGVPKAKRFHEPIPIDEILTATLDGSPLFTEPPLDDRPHLFWAIIAGKDADRIEDRMSVYWDLVSIKRDDMLRLWPALRSEVIFSTNGADTACNELGTSIVNVQARTEVKFDPPTTGLCRRGRRPLVLERVIRSMERLDKVELAAMKEEAMAAQFNASRDTCRKARGQILSKIIEPN